MGNSSEKAIMTLMKITAVSCAGILIVLLITLGIFIPRVLGFTDSLASAAENLDEISESLASEDLVALLTDVKELVVSGQVGIAEAAEKISDFDVETLNDAISNFNSIIDPLARMFGR